MLLESERSSKDKLLPSRGMVGKRTCIGRQKWKKGRNYNSYLPMYVYLRISLHLYIHMHLLYQKVDIYFELSFLKRIVSKVLWKFIIKNSKLLKNDVKRNFLAKKKNKNPLFYKKYSPMRSQLKNLLI